MKPIFIILSFIALTAFAQDKPDLKNWTERFDNETAFDQHWGAYGWHPDGKTSAKKEDRPLWWQLIDGSLRSSNPPGVHPSGITRQVQGQDMRFTLRFKLPPKGLVGIGLNGPNRILERNFHLCGVHISETGINAFDEDNLHPKSSPEAEKLKAEGKMNRKFIGAAKATKMPIAAETWHDLVFEIKGRELAITLNGKEALRYTTLAADAPKMSFQLSSYTTSKEPAFGWFDDITLTSLDTPK